MAPAKKGRSTSTAASSVRRSPAKTPIASRAASVDALIAALPAERRVEIETVRQTINARLPRG